MAVIFITNDLMAGSNLRGAAQAMQVPLSLTADAESAVARCNQERVKLVVLDLSTPGLNPRELVPRLRSSANPPAAIVAFAPHVHQQRLDAATEAGCDEVLSRGQFHGQADALLKRYASEP